MPDSGLPLPTLLSHALVAFTIELDNEGEHRMPHRITRARSDETARGPWLTSLVMYLNLMQFVPDEGATVAALERMARTALSLNGMQRWGYIRVHPDPGDARTPPPQRDWLVRPTRKGLAAKESWRELLVEIEKRWESRFGWQQIARLRESLKTLIGRFTVDLPEYLPVLGYGLLAREPVAAEPRPVEPPQHLPTFLSKVLHAFTIEFERESPLSLAICANVIRLLGKEAVRVRDLPRLSGVSKEAIQMALSFLQERGFATIEPDHAASRTKVVQLTDKGRAARRKYRDVLDAIETRWKESYGEGAIRALRESLEPLALEPLPEPYPDGWRAALPRPETVPHYPMVLHRGGYPDGS